ncbi:MAG: radical SAM protein [Spirochaetota bacterium]|jgi:7-carboxy-7-deazaguanine synthase|nr:radical SAM protein [Spirochaetota bacterium]
MKIFVSEIFRSLQGEARGMLWPAIFIRLAGCNLRCLYCDTAYAWDEGEEMEIEEVMRRVRALGGSANNRVLITGGEPLLQREAALALASLLIQDGYSTSMETNGSCPVDDLPEKLIAIIDVKTPGSGMSGVMNHENFRKARRHHDVFKFVIAGPSDTAWALDSIARYRLDERYDVLLSPVSGKVEARDLAEAILASGRRIRLNLQLHRLIWPEALRGR